MKKNFITLFDFISPRFCHGCESALSPEERLLCQTCRSTLKVPTDDILASEFTKKFLHDGLIRDFAPAYIFEKDGALQNIIHNLKYNNKFYLGFVLGKEIFTNVQERMQEWNIDLIIPVPLFHLKKAERGYNQSYYIAKGISKELKSGVRTNIIKRKIFTPSQTKLNIEERKMNVTGVFSIVNGKAVKNKNILLVDDVITTGSTISECAKLLKENGALNVYAASVALADPLHSLGSA